MGWCKLKCIITQHSLSYLSQAKLECQSFTSFKPTATMACGSWRMYMKWHKASVRLIIQSTLVTQACTVLRHVGANNAGNDLSQSSHLRMSTAMAPALTVHWLKLLISYFEIRHFKCTSLTGRIWWLKRGYEKGKVCLHYVKGTELKQGCAD